MRLIDPAAIGFQLRFARTSRADAAAQPRHLDSASGQPRQQIIQLRQLHLQLAFARAGAAGEYVQNQLRPVQNLAVERALQVALLGRSQIRIEQDHVGFVNINQIAKLFQLARSDERGGIRRSAGPGSMFLRRARPRCSRAPSALPAILRR